MGCEKKRKKCGPTKYKTQKSGCTSKVIEAYFLVVPSFEANLKSNQSLCTILLIVYSELNKNSQNEIWNTSESK